MKAASGIAGSMKPEQQGSFLCRDEFELDWFIGMNNKGGPVDVWEVSGVDPGRLVESPEGHYYLPDVIPPDRVHLAQADVPPAAW